MSARCGAKTLLLECYGLPGGMATIGEVHPFMYSCATPGIPLDGPVYNEWRNAMLPYLPDGLMDSIKHPMDHSTRAINKEAAALAAEDLLLSAGVKILYHHAVVGVKMSAQHIEHLICHTRGGFGVVRGKCYVDCTGDGEVAAMAECPFEMGDENGGCQPMSLCFKLSHVDAPFITNPDGSKSFAPSWRKMLNEKYTQAVAKGEIHCPRENILVFPFRIGDTGVLHFNTTRVCGHNATNGASFSEAEMEGRRQLREILFWLRRDVPGFSQCRLMSMAVQIGVRESRRITGHYYLTAKDFLEHATFPDAIARCAYCIDIHNPTGQGTTIKAMEPGKFYEIPYRAVVPRGCDNLTVGGRPISADVAVHSSLRIMPTAVSIGQGAGAGAALAALTNQTPAAIDGAFVRQSLITHGAPL